MATTETSCTRLYGKYIETQNDYVTATGNLQFCNRDYPNKNPINYSTQKVLSPSDQKKNTIDPLGQQFNDQVALYTSLVGSTKALIAATQPLKDYKSILQQQLNQTSEQNQSMQQKITTSTNIINQESAAVPDLSNAGPFGTPNLQKGVGYAFLAFYILFFILLSVFLYIQFKNSGSVALVITGIFLMLVAAGAGAYFFCISSDYGLGLADAQSFIKSISL